nr:zinc finger protein [Hymenolepis microstoma]
MTEKSNSNEASNDESRWTRECIHLGQREGPNNPLREIDTNLLEPTYSTKHSRIEDDNQPRHEKSEDEIIEQIAGNIFTSSVIRQQNSSNQNDKNTNTPQNVEQIQMEQRMNTNFTTLHGSEADNSGWIRLNEFAKENLTLYRLDNSSSANSAVNYFHCPICSYRSVDRFQIQNHFHAIHEENTNWPTRQASNRKPNSYNDSNSPIEGAISDGSIENITQRSEERVGWGGNVVAETKRASKSDESNRRSTEFGNAHSSTVISSKNGDPKRKHEENCDIPMPSSRLGKYHVINRGINESTPTNSDNHLVHNPNRTFDAAGRPVNKYRLHTINEVNEHSPSVCTADIGTGGIDDKEGNLKENPGVQQLVDIGGILSHFDKFEDRFLSTVRLSAHQLTDIERKQFSCDVCGNTFSQKFYLQRHKREHTGERPNSCKECGKGFSQKSHLTRHLLTHSGERPFTCNICGNQFALNHN